MNQITNTLEAFDPVNAILAELTARHKDVVHDVATTKGMTAAKKDRAEIKGYRVNVEAIRVEQKAPYLKAGADIDTEAKRITAELAKLETSYDEQIKRQERADAEAKRAREEAKRKRDNEIQVRLNAIRNIPADCVGMTAALIRQAREDAGKTVIDQDSFGDLVEAAKATLRNALDKLDNMASAAEAAQAEREELAAQRIAMLAEQTALNNQAAQLKAEREALEAQRPAPIVSDVPAGWDRIEPGFEHMGDAEALTIEKVTKVAPQESLLDLLDAVAPAPFGGKVQHRAATPSDLPSANDITAALSEHAKRRTTIRNVTDVLEAIRAIQNGR